jgi:hypothetical protein
MCKMCQSQPTIPVDCHRRNGGKLTLGGGHDFVYLDDVPLAARTLRRCVFRIVELRMRGIAPEVAPTE